MGRQSVALAASPITAPLTSTSAPTFQVLADSSANTVFVSWDARPEPEKQTSSTLASALNTLPRINLKGASLPAKLIALQLLSADSADENGPAASTDAAAFANALNARIQITQLDSEPIEAALSDPTQVFSTTNLTSSQSQAEPLPAAPVFLLRQARLRGHLIAVFALSPVYAQNGVTHIATHVEAQFAQARVLSPQVVAELMQAPAVGSTQHAQALQTAAPTGQPAQTVWRLTVSQAGIQRVTGQMLADVGLTLASINTQQIHVRQHGIDVALDTRGLDDGRLDPADEIRFFAPEPGDRWNATQAYFLSTESTPTPRMAARSVQAASANPALTLRNTAIQRGVWHNNTRYESLLPGPDGDHWFATQLETPPGARDTDRVQIDLASSLPLAGGPISITLFGTTSADVAHAFTVRMGNAVGQSPADGAFQGAGDWAHSLMLAENAPALEVQLTSIETDSYALDSVAYARPVQLNFAGQSGHFWSVAGAWAYQLEGLPANATLYDLTDAAAPVVLMDVANGQIHDSASGPRHYWISGGDTFAQPVITPDSAAQVTDNDRWSGIDQIYIVPRALRSELTPLLTFRQSQNLLVSAVDVELIYNTWSGGQISPDAIRQFVRYALEQNPALKAITLVGDGSSDPRNFLGLSNPTWIPPYLAMVDPWLGETACDTCYGQVDGDDPLSDLIPDVVIGRLPVKSAADLTQLVNKIIAYETAPLDTWNWRSGHLADNYQDATGKPDAAGNFPAYQDAAVNLQPQNVDVRRAYFDPYLPSANSPWRETDPLQAHANALAMFNNGAAIINFQGHGYYDRLGQTASVAGSSVNYLLHTSDVAQLTNGTKLPMLIEMACWTSAFHQPLAGGSTIDEMLVLAPNGGTIATWGSTGWGVAYQHEYLQKGAYAALWATPQQDATVGNVVQQGLMTLYSEAACCLDAMRTYTLLGDPMTVLHASIPTRTWLPATMNQ